MRFRVGVLAVVLCLVATPSFAQRSVTGGVKVGLNLANISVDPDEGDFKSKAGLAAGVAIDVPINDMVSISPEILYVMKGAKLEEGGETGKIKFNYIDIPILLKANFATGGSARPFIVAGPVLGIKAGKAKIEFGGEEEDISDDVESSDVGIAFGGGVQVGRATVEARYNFGVKDADKDESSKAKHRGFLVLVGVAFGPQ